MRFFARIFAAVSACISAYFYRFHRQHRKTGIRKAVNTSTFLNIIHFTVNFYILLPILIGSIPDPASIKASINSPFLRRGIISPQKSPVGRTLTGVIRSGIPRDSVFSVFQSAMSTSRVMNTL